MQRRAVIAGAGVGGLCTAIGLRQRGWDVTVLERWPDVVGIGAGLGVWPDAQQVLDDLGVGDAFRKRAIPFGATSLFAKDGRRLCAVPARRVERRGGRPVRILSRTDLMELLLDAAAGCEIQTGVDVAEHGALVVESDVLVGADGLRSTVRQRYFPQERSAPRYSGFTAWRGSVPFELDDPRDYGETWGDGALVGITRLAIGRTNWYAALPTDPGEPQTFAEAIEPLRTWRTPIAAVLEASDPDRVLRHPIYDLDPHLDSYVVGRTALLGDAAHSMTPNLGRGACEAIMDAAALVAQLHDAEDVPSALHRYDRARRPATRRAVDRSRQAMRIATGAHARVRETALRCLAPFIG